MCMQVSFVCIKPVHMCNNISHSLYFISFVTKPTIGFSGQKVSLNCTVCADSTVFWILDGEDAILLAAALSKQNVYINQTHIGNITISWLSFIALPRHNHTVSCLVVYGDDHRVEQVDTIIVPIQGLYITYSTTVYCQLYSNTSILPKW